MKITALEREFQFNGTKLPDAGPNLTVEEVRAIYVNTYPELATATIEGPSPEDGVMQYKFIRAVGCKRMTRPMRGRAFSKQEAKVLRELDEVLRGDART